MDTISSKRMFALTFGYVPAQKVIPHLKHRPECTTTIHKYLNICHYLPILITYTCYLPGP